MPKREYGSGGLFRPHGSKVWWAQWYDAEGKKHRISTESRVKAEAQQTLLKELQKSASGKIAPDDARRITYGNLREALLESYRRKENKSLQVLDSGEETIWGLSALDSFFPPDTPATAITPDKIDEFVQARRAERPRKSNATINNSLALLRRMFSLALRAQKLQHAPHVEMVKAPPARKGFLERADFEKLLSALPVNLHPLVTFLYYCGGRLGEALQIQWSQVDLKAALIRLEAEQTKNAEPRVIPLPDVLVGMLGEIEAKEGIVFDSVNLRKAWLKACIACGFGQAGSRRPGLLIHDMRRSAIRNLSKAGVPDSVSMRISGHRTRAVFERYNIIAVGQIQDAMKRVEAMPAPVAPRALPPKKTPQRVSSSTQIGASLVKVPLRNKVK